MFKEKQETRQTSTFASSALGSWALEETGWRLLRSVMAGASCLAAFLVLLACFASPGHFLPIVSVTAFCGAAIVLGKPVSRTISNPTALIFPPPSVILVGAIIGIASINNELQGEWLVILGNLRALGGWEALSRFFVAFAAIGTLAVFSTSPTAARALSVFAVSGPVILLLYPARAVVEGYWPAAHTWTTQGGLLAGAFGLIIVWAIVVRRLLALERLRDVIRRRTVPQVLRLQDFRSIDRSLGMLEGWLDPLHRVNTAVNDVVRAETHQQRQGALSRALGMLEGRSHVLPGSGRSTLEATADRRPEAAILLAEDAFLRKRSMEAFIILMRTMDELALDSEWLADAAIALWERHRSCTGLEAQQALWHRVTRDESDSAPAFAALAMIAWEEGLSPEIADSLSRATQPSSPSAGLLACQNAHEGRIQEVFPCLLPILPKVPDAIARRKFLPGLREAASKSAAAQREWFFRKDERPQLLEVIEAPLTSIYGGRIASWTFVRSGTSEPESFAVTGHGPGPVCARVSAILTDLANERSCASDLILAGASFFDLTAPISSSQRPAVLDATKLMDRVRGLGKRLNIEELVDPPPAQTMIAKFAARMRAPSIDTARESLLRVEKEMGFVVNRTLGAEHLAAARDALDQPCGMNVPESFPVLAKYRRDGQPLQLKLPLLCLGVQDYDRVVKEYRRTVREEMQQEWERRRRKYEEWSRQFASRFHALRAKLAQLGQAALELQEVYIHVGIDPETATERRYDRPRVMSELEYMTQLPFMTLDQLLYWAWADHKVETLPAEEEFEPHWERTCLVDAFLRGWPLPSEDKDLNAAREDWASKWRPLALVALTASLREAGLSLSDIAVENTVFRVVGDDDDWLTMEVLHVWDPFCDSLPTAGEGAIRLFVPAFGGRQRNLLPARKAQKRASESMRDALATASLRLEDLYRALSLDSGQALDLLIEHLIDALRSDGLDQNIARVMEQASRATDPLASFQLREKLAKCSLVDLLTLASECGSEGREPNAVPDFLAWELYLVGEGVRTAAKKIVDQVQETYARLVRDTGQRPPQLQLPLDVDPDAAGQLSASTAWQIVEQLIHDGPQAGTGRAILKFLNSNPVAQAARLNETHRLLAGTDAGYATRCFNCDGPPPASDQRKKQFAPGCFTGGDRIFYDIAEGDAALGLSWLLREGAGCSDRAVLVQLACRARDFSIAPTFEDLVARRNRCVAEIERLAAPQTDRISLRLAAASIRQALIEVLTSAEASYTRAALRDPQYGCGWLRLARLKWLTAHYQEALSIIVGPPQRADLQASQLPLAVAVRAAGANLDTMATSPDVWNGPENAEVGVRRAGSSLVLEVSAAGTQIGSCTISSLGESDKEVLEAFFADYRPNMLRSLGATAFEEWIRLIQIPSLGSRAAVAGAVSEGGHFPLLAACVYLGVPDVLGLPPDSSGKPRPAEWLEKDVVTKVNWRCR